MDASYRSCRVILDQIKELQVLLHVTATDFIYVITCFNTQLSI